MELYAIVKTSGSGLEDELLWAGQASSEYAEELAAKFAVSRGNVSLLSGRDLGWFLLREHPPVSQSTPT